MPLTAISYTTFYKIDFQSHNATDIITVNVVSHNSSGLLELTNKNYLLLRLYIVQFASSILPRYPMLISMSSSAALAPIGTPDSADVTTWKESLTSPLPVSTVRSLHTRELYGGTYEGYMQSKWVGEQLAWEAHARG
jgi:hypothetical protein